MWFLGIGWLNIGIQGRPFQVVIYSKEIQGGGQSSNFSGGGTNERS